VLNIKISIVPAQNNAKKKKPSKKKVRGKGTEGRQGREGREKEGGGCDMPQGNRSKSG